MADEAAVLAQETEQAASGRVGAEGELKSMGEIARSLDSLSPDNDALARVLTWVNQRYGAGIKVRSVIGEHLRGPAEKPQEPSGEGNNLQYDSLADLFSAAAPNTEADKALVVAYWLQVYEKQADWTGFAVHSQMKHLGHGIGNITQAIDSLISQKPQLAMQTRKSGPSKQARKQYKLTVEGTKRVRQMLAQTSIEDPIASK